MGDTPIVSPAEATIPDTVSPEISEKFTVDKNTFLCEQVPDPARKIEVEIGDSKQEKFYPQFKTLHWDNEANFSLRLVDGAYEEAEVRTVKDKIEWERAGRIARMYNVDGFEDGGFEFEVELSAPPASNVLEFSIQAKGFDFFYQPELTDEEKTEGGQRPENVIGSYAVYHKTKANNYVGGKEYRVGKAFHIYRPNAVDANGKETWCDLSIDEANGLLTVTVPQKFLDDAIYPVKIDPTFGYTTIGASTLGTLAPHACQFTTIEAGTITSITTYESSSSTPAVLGNAIYSESAGIPDAKLAEDSGNVSLSTTPAWVTTNLSYTFLASTNYWLAQWPNGFNGNYYYDVGSTGQRSFSSGTFEIWPNPWTNSGTSARKVSIYATYTAAATSIPNKVFQVDQAINRAASY